MPVVFISQVFRAKYNDIIVITLNVLSYIFFVDELAEVKHDISSFRHEMMSVWTDRQNEKDAEIGLLLNEISALKQAMSSTKVSKLRPVLSPGYRVFQSSTNVSETFKL